ncbi:hypothetical protein PH551_16830, partial [Rhizobium sp. CNPSo 3490]|nr:hypothetical protein [Rhizobium sp. CNPSo 3490]
MRRQLRIIALDVLFTRLAWQTKVKIITENEKPKQTPAASRESSGRCFPPHDRLPISSFLGMTRRPSKPLARRPSLKEANPLDPC